MFPHMLTRLRLAQRDETGRINFVVMQWLINLTCLLPQKEFGFLTLLGFRVATAASKQIAGTFFVFDRQTLKSLKSKTRFAGLDGIDVSLRC
ncbi:MAG: hypothetical protein LBN41_10375 [Enterobacteriaceae bacterium]|jgi:hypothetical protein|nr:hypothetical protein [Enterobacteriaceae bacterium]